MRTTKAAQISDSTHSLKPKTYAILTDTRKRHSGVHIHFALGNLERIQISD